MTKDQAEILALQALAYLAEIDKERSAFFEQTGIGHEEIRKSATDSAMLGSVLDFLLSDERRLLSCCQTLEWEPTLPARARAELPGATSGIWE
jgi:hypothetical protein